MIADHRCIFPILFYLCHYVSDRRAGKRRGKNNSVYDNCNCDTLYLQNRNFKTICRSVSQSADGGSGISNYLVTGDDRIYYLFYERKQKNVEKTVKR